MSHNQTSSALDELVEFLLPYWQKKLTIIAFAFIGLIIGTIWSLFNGSEEIRINIESTSIYDVSEDSKSLSGSLQKYIHAFNQSRNFKDWESQNATHAKSLSLTDVTGLYQFEGETRIVADSVKVAGLHLSPKNKLVLLVRNSQAEKISAARHYALFTAKKLTARYLSEIAYLIDELKSHRSSGGSLDSTELSQLIELEVARKNLESPKLAVSVGYPSSPLPTQPHAIVIAILAAFIGAALGVLLVFASLLVTRLNELSERS